MAYLVENPEDRFSRDEAQMKVCFFFPFQQGLTSFFIFPRVDLYPYLLNGLVHPYHLDESISNFRGVYFIIFILFFIENPLSKQCKP